MPIKLPPGMDSSSSEINPYAMEAMDKLIISLLPDTHYVRTHGDIVSFKPSLCLDDAMNALYTLYNPEWGYFNLQAISDGDGFAWLGGSAHTEGYPLARDPLPSMAICLFLILVCKGRMAVDAWH